MKYNTKFDVCQFINIDKQKRCTMLCGFTESMTCVLCHMLMWPISLAHISIAPVDISSYYRKCNDSAIIIGNMSSILTYLFVCLFSCYGNKNGFYINKY